MATKINIPCGLDLDEEGMITAANKLMPSQQQLFDVVFAVSHIISGMRNPVMWERPSAHLAILAFSLVEIHARPFPKIHADGEKVVSVVAPRTEDVQAWGKSYLQHISAEMCDEFLNATPLTFGQKMLQILEHLDPNISVSVLQKVKQKWRSRMRYFYETEHPAFYALVPHYKALMRCKTVEGLQACLWNMSIQFAGLVSVEMPAAVQEAMVNTACDLAMVDIALTSAQTLKEAAAMLKNKGAQKVRHKTKLKKAPPKTPKSEATALQIRVAVDNTK